MTKRPVAVRRAAWLVVALTLVPLALAQSGTPQDVIDATPTGGVARLGAGDHEGAVAVDRAMTVEGEDGATILRLTGPGSGNLVTVSADGVVLRYLDLRDADVGLVVDGAVTSVGPVRFRDNALDVDARAGATVFLLNDPAAPLNAEVDPAARFYFAALGFAEASDQANGDPVQGLTADILDADGNRLGSFGPSAGAGLEVSVPTHELRSDGSRAAVLDAMRVRLRADGYDDVEVPATRFADPAAGPVVITMAASGAATGSASGGVATPFGQASVPVVVASGVAAVAAAGAGASAFVVRSERRLWRVAAFFAPLFTRLKRAKLLDAPLRERIHAHIEAHPGVRYRELQRALSLPNGALAHHIQILVREQLVVERAEGRAVRFFLPGVAADDIVDTGARVLAFVRDNPGATGKDVAAGLDLKASLASYHLKKLGDAGALVRKRDGLSVRAYAAEGEQAAQPAGEA